METVELLLKRYEAWDSEDEREDYIEKLEIALMDLMDAAADDNPEVDDSVYDTLKDYLQELKPSSKVLKTIWSKDDENVVIDTNLDKFLLSYPLLSIETIKSYDVKAFKTFVDKLPNGDIEVVAGCKENGHGIRGVYSKGLAVKAHSRGRHTSGRDITEQFKLFAKDKVDVLENFDVIEVRGEVLLPFSNLDEARKYNPKIKNAFTGVSSMIRASASEEETKLLRFVAYDLLSDDLYFDKLSDKFEYLEFCGFEVPKYKVFTINKATIRDDIDKILEEMEQLTDGYDFFMDGIVLSVNDTKLFKEMGEESNIRYGNIALKMGLWKQDGYSGIIKEIRWGKKSKKTKKTPVAILEEPVLTASGNSVEHVPLYAPVYILMLEAYPGKPIYFKYGGESGVVPTTKDGRLVTDKTLTE